jgi:hypothetical protein
MDTGCVNEIVSIRWNNSGAFMIYVLGVLKITGATAFSNNTWYRVELHVKIDPINGLVEFRLDGVLDGTWWGNTGSGTILDHLRIYAGGGGAGLQNSFYVDDIAINDTAGLFDNSWIGDGHVIALVPNANGDANQWTGSDGDTTNNYQLIDEAPSNSDTDFIVDSTSGHKDLYGIPDMSAWVPGQQATRVWGEVRARSESADGTSLQVGIKTGDGTEDFTQTTTPIAEFYMPVKSKEYVVNPHTGIEWTAVDIAALQVGVKIP